MILAELIDEYVSGDWGNEELSDDTPNAVFCIRAADFVPILSVDYTNIPMRYISDSSFENKLLQVGDIVIEKSGGSPTQSTGRVIIITEELLKEKQYIVCSNFCEAFRVKEGWNPFYVFSYLQFLYNEGVFFNFEGKTSGLKNLQMEQAFSSIDIPEQKCDISILASIEEKIAMNRKINIELEALAKEIYDYWFVQFDFPNEEGKPYKSSGGKMMWNETLKREIPEGWSEINLFDGLDILYGYPFATEYFTDDSQYKPIVRIRDILEGKNSTFSSEEVDEKYRLQEEDAVIGMDGNFHINIWHRNDTYLNQRCVRLREKDSGCITILQAYFAIKPYLKAKEKVTKGSTVGHLSDKDLKEFFLVNPLYTSLFTPHPLIEITKNIVEKRKEVNELQSLRSYLLPLLMNGQITIKD